MVISITPRGNAITQRPEPVRPVHPVEIDDIDSLRLRLAQLLQTSLDLKEIIRLFFNGIQEAVVVDGINYHSNIDSYESEIGKRGKHSVSYQLSNSNEDCGEMVFTRNRRFDEDELMTIELLLPHVMFPVRNAMMYRQAMISATTDRLTGIANRFAFDQTVTREIELAKRYNSNLSLVVADIDRFKYLNDQYGHAVGDQVLVAVAATLDEVTRTSDACFRYGGEEFVILLSNTDKDGAEKITERLRLAIAEQTHLCNNQAIKVTASFGIAQLESGDNQQSLFSKADKALYKAKKAGRNCVVSD